MKSKKKTTKLSRLNGKCFICGEEIGKEAEYVHDVGWRTHIYHFHATCLIGKVAEDFINECYKN